MATWPIARANIRRKVRMKLQDLSSTQAEQDTPDDDSTTNQALGINTYIDSAIRQVCSELDVLQASFREFIPMIAGQSIYALTAATAAGAYDIQEVMLSPTTGFSGNLTDQFLEQILSEITFNEMREMIDSPPAKSGSLGSPLYWCRYPRAANTTAEQTPRFQVWPPPDAASAAAKTLSPLWVGPVVGLASDATVLSLPAPADEAVADWVAWRLLDDRGDHGDAARAERKYREEILLLTGTHGSRDRLYPRRPVDAYGVL